jgi:hypothetical protein
MGKINRSLCIVLCCIAFLRPDGYSQHVLNGFHFTETEFRESLVKILPKYLHVRENFYWKNGNRVFNNRGNWVDDIQRRSGCPLGCYWCGAFMWCLFDDMGVDAKRDFGVFNPLQVKAWFSDSKRIVYQQGQGNKRVGVLPQKGDVARMFYSHIEMYIGDDWVKDVARKRVKTVGGNTGGGTPIQGVHITERPLSNIQYIANHISPYFTTLKK